MFKTSKGIKSSFMASIATAINAVFGPSGHKQVKQHNQSKHFRSYYGRAQRQNPSGSKIRRAIERGNHGVVNKHGMVGRAVAEWQREKWLQDNNKPYIRLSTSI